MRVLVVEDEPRLNRLIERALEEAGFAVDVAHDGEEAAFLGETEPYDAAILDLGLPRLDGVSVLRRWRDNGRSFPVLVLTARGRWADKAQAFDAGADDYLVKPFEMDEAITRVRVLIRRASGHATAEIACGPVVVDTAAGKVRVDGASVALTGQEFRILSYLAHHRGQVVSRADLADHVYDRDDDRDSNVLDVLIGRIRKKLGVDVITTLRGQGWRLEETSDGNPIA